MLIQNRDHAFLTAWRLMVWVLLCTGDWGFTGDLCGSYGEKGQRSTQDCKAAQQRRMHRGLALFPDRRCFSSCV